MDRGRDDGVNKLALSKLHGLVVKDHKLIDPSTDKEWTPIFMRWQESSTDEEWTPIFVGSKISSWGWFPLHYYSKCKTSVEEALDAWVDSGCPVPRREA